MKTAFALTWLCVLAVPDQAAYDSQEERFNNPLFLWPFSNWTTTSEVMNQRDAFYLHTYTCSKFEDGPPDFGFSAYVFDGTERTAASTYITDDDEVDKLSLVFMIYPENNTGEILEFNGGDSYRYDYIASLKVELWNSKLLVVMKDRAGNTVCNGSSDDNLSLRTWHWVVISWDKDDEQVYLFVNETKKGLHQRTGMGKLLIQGYLSLSMPSSFPMIRYKGRFCCLGIWDTSIGNFDIASFTSYLKIKSWLIQKRPSVSNYCGVTAPSSGPPILNLWPLSNISSGYDVIRGLEPAALLGFQCMRTKNIYPATNRTVLYLDGSVFSFVQTNISESIFNNDFTIAIAVEPDYLVEGVIWDYVSADGATGMTLRFEMNYTMLEIKSGKSVCSTVKNFFKVPPNVWSFVSVTYEAADNSYKLFVNSTANTTTSDCRNGSDPDKIGILSIGKTNYDQPFDIGYHGSAACLTIIQGAFNVTRIQALVQEKCADLDVHIPTINNGSCNGKTTKDGKRFGAVSNDSRPHGAITPINRYTVRSLLECSTLCQRFSACRSFVVLKKDLSFLCHIYDIVTKPVQKCQSGCRYYVTVVDVISSRS